MPVGTVAPWPALRSGARSSKPSTSRRQGCARCPQLAAARTTVVFGSGNADADLMFVGEAPGANEDKQGVPFVGQAGQAAGHAARRDRPDARRTSSSRNVFKCRPPGNRDPLPQEIDNCQDYLFRQLELIEPRVVCTLGNFATKLLRADPPGITRLHGRDEERLIGPRRVRLYPLFHPAAALYTPSMLETCARTSGACRALGVAGAGRARAAGAARAGAGAGAGTGTGARRSSSLSPNSAAAWILLGGF